MIAKVKKSLKIILLLELLAIPIAFVKYSMLCSGVDCGFDGVNIIAVYIAPLIALTAFILFISKLYETRSKTSTLKPDQKFIHFLIAGLILITIIYGIYAWFNR